MSGQGSFRANAEWGQPDLPFADAVVQPPDQADPARNEAKRSIDYMVRAALEFGKFTGIDDLCDSVARFHQYKPYNALLLLLQRPGAIYLLPAHRWGEEYGRHIRPSEQPLVALQPGGPVMFLFDISQTEATESTSALPPGLANPFTMSSRAEAEGWVHWVIENAKMDGVRVHDAGLGQRFAGCIMTSEPGITQPSTGPRGSRTSTQVRYEVLLNRNHNAAEKLATLAHELGHLYCGHIGTHDQNLWADRQKHTSPEQRELEADAVAHLVAKRHFPGVELPSRFRQSLDTRSSSLFDLETTLVASGRVLEMTRGYAPRRTYRPSRTLDTQTSAKGRG